MRSAAIAAGILAAAIASTAHADCTKLNGTYRFRSTEQVGGASEALGNLTRGSSKLVKVEGNAAQGGFASSQPRARPKVTDIAVAATLTYSPGTVRLRFVDAAGAELANLSLETLHPWTCSGDRLVRTFQRIGGLGDNIRTERVEEAVERDGKGPLVHRETITVIDGGHGTTVRFWHYPVVAAAR